MGCICNNNEKLVEVQNEFRPEFAKLEEKFKQNEKLFNTLMRAQAIIRGMQYRKDFLSRKTINPNDPSNYQITEFKIIDTDKITDDELDQLYKEYAPLDDGIKVEKMPPVEFPNKVIYSGEWDKDNKLRHGRGIQIWSDGSKFFGCWKNGKASGRGKLIHADGDIYEGEWENDKPNGQGLYIHQDGTKYEGGWKDDKQNGKGKEIWPDGASYEGGYKDGKKQGNGIFKWADGSTYDGEFDDNNISGKGLYIFSDGRKYEGTWLNNKLEGHGIFEWPDGRKYSGEYKDDKKEGFGIFEWADGKKYKGPWKNGKQHGTGEFFIPDKGIWKKGEWENGKRIRWITSEDPATDVVEKTNEGVNENQEEGNDGKETNMPDKNNENV